MQIKQVFAILMVFCLAATSNVSAATLVIPGTGDGVAVLKSIGIDFEKETGVAVQVPKSIGSGGGVKAAGADKTILARVARKVKDKEKHFGLSYKPVFEVPTVFPVHASVGVNNLSEQQVLDIFSGKITNWKSVGGSDAQIVVVRREDGDSSLKNLKKTFPGFKDISLTSKAFTATKTPIMVAQIKNRPNTIGFGPYDVALDNDLKVLSISGNKPASKDYKYHGTIGLVYKEKNLDETTKSFLEFAASPKAHDAITRAGGKLLR